jgi:hypothetical protein
LEPAEPLPRLLAVAKLRMQALADPPRPRRVAFNPSRPFPEGEPIFCRLCLEVGLVFQTRSTHRPQWVT